ncbi:MAG TPA: thiamine phosphate synthase [Candidatus Methanoperedens sp.]|nr:thiamine phosphate synthase [Candidatus Methanoperedens sp.]
MSRAGAPPLIVIPDPRFMMGTDLSSGERGARRGTLPEKKRAVPLLEALAAAALAGGADAIQLRAKALPGDEVLAVGRRLAAACRACGALFFVNDDAAAALACSADGVHVGPGDSAPAEARQLLGPHGLIGVSVYEPADLAAAEAAGAAYVAVGAVYPTATKKIAAVGLEGVRRLREATRLPIVAIGGITAANAADAIAAGAGGVAVISAVSAAADPAGATRELRAVVIAALEARGRG